MPGGGKGPSSSGTVTQTTQNPTQQAQLPFLTGQAVQSANQPGFNTPAGFDEALQLNETNPLQYFPGQTLANQNPAMATGFQDQINRYGTGLSIADQGRSLFGDATGGGFSGGSSPAYGGFQGLSTGGTSPQQGMAGLSNGLQYLGDTTANALARSSNPGQGDLLSQSGALNNVSGQALANPYGGALGTQGTFGSGIDPTKSQLQGYGQDAAANPYASQLGQLQQYGSGAQPVWNSLSGIAGNAISNPYATALTQEAQSAPINGLPTAYGGLSGEAQGQFLGQNPYLDSEFNAAARPVVNAYQTAVQPGIDSNSEAAGRYGSGAQANAQSIAQQNLGKSLGDMGANLYGQDYANERGLMQSAQGELGNLGLSEYGARTGALNQAGNQFLGGLSAATGANQAAGGLLQNEFSLRGNLLGQAGNQYLSGLSTGIGADTASGQLANQDFQNKANALGTAGSLYNTGIGNAVGARQAASSADSSYLNSILGGVGAQQNAYTAAGQLDNANLSGIEAGANGLQSGFDSGNRNSLIGLGMEPTVMSQNYAPAQQMTAGGQGLTSLEQQQINDAQNRFYGQIQAPWQQATQYMNLIGNPQTGSSGTTTPILGPNGFSSALGTLGSLGSLGSNLGLFGGGSGGAGLIGGGGLGFDASLPSFASFGTPTAAELASATLAPEFGAGAAASTGGSILADFLPFLGF